MDKKKKRKSFFLYQPVLIRLLVDLRNLEKEDFAPYQIQDFFWPTLCNIFAASPQDFYEIQRHMYLPIFPKSRFNLKFWTILDKMVKIRIMQVQLNKIGEKVERFFPRDIQTILKKEKIETLEDFFYYRNLYDLFRYLGTKIDPFDLVGLFDLGFHEMYNHLYLISALKKADYGETSTVEHSIQITNVQKISRLKKMRNIFKFDTLKVSEFFGWKVYRLLTEAGLKTLKDVIDFEEIDTLIPQEHRREFDLKLSAVYYSFSFLEEINKRIKR